MTRTADLAMGARWNARQSPQRTSGRVSDAHGCGSAHVQNNRRSAGRGLLPLASRTMRRPGFGDRAFFPGEPIDRLRRLGRVRARPSRTSPEARRRPTSGHAIAEQAIRALKRVLNGFAGIPGSPCPLNRGDRPISAHLTPRIAQAQTSRAAAHSAAGICSPITQGASSAAPSTQALFSCPRVAGQRSRPIQWRAVRGEPQGSPVPCGRSANPRTVRHPAFCSAVADSTHKESSMNRSARAAAAAIPESLFLPIEAPRDAWPCLIEHAADALAGRCIHDSETLALELRAIAAALRAEVSA